MTSHTSINDERKGRRRMMGRRGRGSWESSGSRKTRSEESVVRVMGFRVRRNLGNMSHS